MPEHCVPHNVVQLLEHHDHVRHHLGLVLLHQLVHQRKHVLMQQLTLLVVDRLDSLRYLLQQIDARTRQGVQHAMTNKLH